MKRKFGFAIAAFALATGGFALEGRKAPVAIEQKAPEDVSLGRESVMQIRTEYQMGAYDSFLKEMDASYDQVKEEGQLEDFAKQREGSQLNLQWLSEVKELQKEKNGQLLQAVGEEDSLFGDKVRSIANFSSTEEEESAITKIASLHQMAPGTGKNADENKLIDIDLEYEYKTLHLNVPEFGLNKKALYYALKMEQMDKMLLASQSFEDASLKSEIEILSRNFDARLAHTWDLMDLQDLAKGRVKPIGPAQERVVFVLQSHQEKMGDLAKNYTIYQK